MSFNFYYIRTDDFPAHAGGGPGVVITRENYEAYFVMYVDDELNASDRRAVEQFIQQHPDLEEEMVMLQQSVLKPNDHIVFEPKELLYKGAAGQTFINEHNCEEYFVLYGDNELTNAEKEKVEQFVYHHPQYQAEFELLQQVKLVPDNGLRFPDKTYLYRTEEDDNRIIAFPWWRFTAAAIALLVVGSLAWYIVGNTGKKDVAGFEPSANSGTNEKRPAVTTPGNNAVSNAVTSSDVAVEKTPAPTNQTGYAKQPVETILTANRKKNISDPRNKQEHLDVQLVKRPVPAPETDNNSIAIKPKLIKVAVYNPYEKPAVKGDIIKGTTSEPIAVHTVASKTNDETDQSSVYVLNAPINKTPLRGFFRKVSRVVDRVTNPEENGKKGIRIANLEIAVN